MLLHLFVINSMICICYELSSPHSWEMAGGLYGSGGFRELQYCYECERQSLLTHSLSWLRPGRTGGLCFCSGGVERGQLLKLSKGIGGFISDLLYILRTDHVAGEVQSDQTTRNRIKLQCVLLSDGWSRCSSKVNERLKSIPTSI